MASNSVGGRREPRKEKTFNKHGTKGRTRERADRHKRELRSEDERETNLPTYTDVHMEEAAVLQRKIYTWRM